METEKETTKKRKTSNEKDDEKILLGMQPERTIIYEYQEILLGHQTKFKVCFSCTDDEKIRVGGIIWRYAVTHLLHWTPEEAVANMTHEIAAQLYLNKTYEYMGYKEEAKSTDFDFKLVLQHAFPGRVKFDIYEQTIETYQKVMKLGKWKNDTNTYQFPKKFFLDEYGSKRASIALNYAISADMPSWTIEEMYDFFSNKTEATKWLREKKLVTNIRRLYTSPLEYFHHSIPSEMRDRFLYHNSLYNMHYEDYIKELKQAQKKAKKSV